MIALRKRLSALEGASNSDLSPAVKAWLGQPLSADEQRQVESGAGVEWSSHEIDTSGWSAEIKQWLGVN